MARDAERVIRMVCDQQKTERYVYWGFNPEPEIIEKTRYRFHLINNEEHTEEGVCGGKVMVLADAGIFNVGDCYIMTITVEDDSDDS